MRLLAIDHGAARSGLALSDPHGITCSPLEVVCEREEQVLIDRIRAVVADQEVGEVVVGLPRPLSGARNEQQQAAEAFAARLAADLGIPVHLWDERFTSKLAERPPAGMSSAPAGRRRRSSRGRGPGAGGRGAAAGQARDAVAACHLLQSFLDARATTGGPALKPE